MRVLFLALLLVTIEFRFLSQHELLTMVSRLLVHLTFFLVSNLDFDFDFDFDLGSDSIIGLDFDLFLWDLVSQPVLDLSVLFLCWLTNSSISTIDISSQYL